MDELVDAAVAQETSSSSSPVPIPQAHRVMQYLFKLTGQASGPGPGAEHSVTLASSPQLLAISLHSQERTSEDFRNGVMGVFKIAFSACVLNTYSPNICRGDIILPWADETIGVCLTSRCLSKPTQMLCSTSESRVQGNGRKVQSKPWVE